MSKICLNMIVKNEMANLPRLLASVAPHIYCYCILDTGSTDGTLDLVRDFFDDRHIPGYEHQGPFENFAQARNLALDHALDLPLPFEYLLFLDADMELSGEFPDGLEDLAYDMLQQDGALSYWNTRMMRRHVGGRYVGVTHEFLSLPVATTKLEGVKIIDHATGSNRGEKYERDVRLLKGAVEKDPKDARSWFYLANTYRDGGDHWRADECYDIRIALGGWDEEVWNAHLSRARCQLKLGNDDAFISGMLATYNLRPSRAEPLYDLAKFYRERGKQQTSLIFSKLGTAIPYPKDILFVEDYPYKFGFREEYSICGFYNERARPTGFYHLNRLILDRATPEHTRSLAKYNSFWYVPKLAEIAPSFTAHPADFIPPDGYVATNPSIVMHKGELLANIRTVNYRITKAGQYDMQGDTAIRTRNFLLPLSGRLHPAGVPIVINWARPPAAYDQVIGMEDVRLISHENDLWASATVREQNTGGWCEQVMFSFYNGNVAGWRRISLPGTTEKNWMPVVNDGRGIEFIYQPGKIVDCYGKLVHEFTPHDNVEDLRGGSQLVPFGRGHVALVHEALARPDNGQRYYQHRFMFFNGSRDIITVSDPFVFHDKQIEFAAGLCWHPDGKRLVVSYGVRDCEAWFATISADDVTTLLECW